MSHVVSQGGKDARVREGLMREEARKVDGVSSGPEEELLFELGWHHWRPTMLTHHEETTVLALLPKLKNEFRITCKSKALHESRYLPDGAWELGRSISEALNL